MSGLKLIRANLEWSSAGQWLTADQRFYIFRDSEDRIKGEWRVIPLFNTEEERELLRLSGMKDARFRTRQELLVRLQDAMRLSQPGWLEEE